MWSKPLGCPAPIGSNPPVFCHRLLWQIPRKTEVENRNIIYQWGDFLYLNGHGLDGEHRWFMIYDDLTIKNSIFPVWTPLNSGERMQSRPYTWPCLPCMMVNILGLVIILWRFTMTMENLNFFVMGTLETMEHIYKTSSFPFPWIRKFRACL